MLKLTVKEPHNTERWLLDLIDEATHRGLVGVSPEDCVRHKYATTNQPEKKAATMRKHLDALVRRGLLRTVSIGAGRVVYRRPR